MSVAPLLTPRPYAWERRLRHVLGGRSRALSPSSLLAAGVTFGLAYGAAMGSYTGLWDGRPLQLLYSALKVPLLLGVSFIVALPSFFALNTIFGVRDDFGRVLRALLSAQATLTVTLLSLAPLTIWFYAGNRNYELAVLWNALIFLVAAVAAQVTLRRAYQPLIARDRRHRPLIWIWGLCYAFVGIQAGWVLRPFIGDPSQPIQFFREGAWGNAYVEVIRLATAAAGG